MKRTTSSAESTKASAPQRLARVRRLSAAGCLGAALGLIIAIIVALIGYREQLTSVDPEQLGAAESRWQQQALRDYDIEVEVSLQKTQHYRVEVRGGTVTAASLNGRPLTRRHAFSTWSVPGMFTAMRRDLRRNEQIAAGQSRQPAVELRARFHAKWGYPERVIRTELTRYGSNPQASWKVVAFHPGGAADDG